MIIIGTTALAKHGIILRESQDVDVMLTEDPYNMDIAIKEGYDIVPINEIVYNVMCKYLTSTLPYATPDMVYTIKCSHLGWSNPSWQKHKKDILALKEKGCVLIQIYIMLYWIGGKKT